MESMRHLKYEKLIAVMLDSACHYLSEFEVSRGTVNSSIASPREIFIEAMRVEAVNIILLHNHPSGDPTPSREDVNMTRNMIEAGNLIGIHIIDHVVIGDNRYISFCENDLLNK
jgi:DNA repair protein RadC